MSRCTPTCATAQVTEPAPLTTPPPGSGPDRATGSTEPPTTAGTEPPGTRAPQLRCNWASPHHQLRPEGQWLSHSGPTIPQEDAEPGTITCRETPKEEDPIDQSNPNEQVEVAGLAESVSARTEPAELTATPEPTPAEGPAEAPEPAAESAAGNAAETEQILDLAGRLAALRGRPCLVYCGDFPHQPDKTAIRHVVDGIPEGPLDVLLTSCGGSLDTAAWWIWRLRERCRHIAVFVPDHAKSAASAFCLGAAEIVLGPDGELGPIDPHRQQRSGASYPRPTSVNTITHGYSSLTDITISLLERLEERNRTTLGLDLVHAVELAHETATELLAPLFGKTSLAELGEARRATAHSAQVASLLARNGQPHRSQAETDQLVNHLLHGFTDHCVALDVDDSIGVGFPARRPDPAERELLVEAQAIVRGVDCQRAQFTVVEPPAPRAEAGSEEIAR